MKASLLQASGHVFFIIIFVCSAHSEGTYPRGITLDGTVGTAGELNLQGPDYDIKAEYGEQAGANLFHSFRQFNIHSDESATFNGPASIQNIIARVTGGNASWIDGKLRSAIPEANLYLLNSSGIMFGPNASLDISGSLYLTTADYLCLGENGRFNAISRESDVLSAAEPSAFGFLQKQDTDIAPISLEGKEDRQEETSKGLRLSEKKAFSVIAGDIEIKNESIVVPQGGIDMVSVASAGEAIPSVSDIDVSSYEKMGNITISDGSLADIKGSGSIFIRAGAFLLSDSSINAEISGTGKGGITDIQADTVSLSDGASLSASSPGQGDGGDIRIRAKESLTLSGNNEAGDASRIMSRSESEDAEAGDAGTILVETKNLVLKDGAWISGSTFGGGRGGDISLSASESVNFSGNNTKGLGCSIGSMTYGEKAGAGDAGNIFIETKQLSFTDGAWIGTESSGSGKGGDITVHASESFDFSGNSKLGYAGGIVSQSNSRESFAGDAGNILIETGNIFLKDGGGISADTKGPGNGGTVTVRAWGRADFSGVNPYGENEYSPGSSGITARSESRDGNAGKGGDIVIESRELSLSGGALVAGGTSGCGKGGDVTIAASESVTLSGSDSDGNESRIVARSEYEDAKAGDAGNILIESPDISLKQGAWISGSSGGGEAGDILIKTKQLSFDGGIIAAQSFGTGKGGDITVRASESVELSGNSNGFGSGILSQSNSEEPDAGDAGNILIETGDIFLKDGGGISAKTSGPGKGGTITVRASGRADFSGVNPYGGNEYSLGSGITARSESRDGNAGKGGDIVIEAGELSLSGGALVESGTSGSGKGGDVTIAASESVTVSGSDSEGNASHVTARSEYEEADAGDAGNILIESPNISLKQGAWISSSTFGGGRGGNVTLNAAESVSLSENESVYGMGCSIGSVSYNEGSHGGDGGTISIETGRLSFTDGAWIGSETSGSGKGGDVFVRASESLRFSGNSNMGYANGMVSRTNGQNADAGASGNIFIETKDLSFKDGGGISASTMGPGNGGSVTIQASGSVELTAVNPHGRNEYGFGTGIYALSEGIGADSGKAGNISLNADTLSLTDGAFINTSTLGSGSAGSIDISVNKSAYISGDSSETEQKPPLWSQLELQEATLPRADERFAISGIYSASANTASYAGDAGKITLTATDLTVSDGSSLTTQAQNAGGGKIIINGDNLLYLRNGNIATDVRGGDGNGGDIDMGNPEFLILNHSRVIADAYGGNGGNIHIVSDQFIQSRDSIVSASSKLGIDGTITIEGPKSDLSSELMVLPGNFLDASQWMRIPCSQRIGEKISRFVITGRDATPTPLDDWLPAPSLWF